MLALKCSLKGSLRSGVERIFILWEENGELPEGYVMVHPETLMMGLVKLWFSCSKEQKGCCQLARVCS